MIVKAFRSGVFAFIVAGLSGLAAAWFFLWFLTAADLDSNECQGRYSLAAADPVCRHPVIALNVFAFFFVLCFASFIAGILQRKGREAGLKLALRAATVPGAFGCAWAVTWFVSSLDVSGGPESMTSGAAALTLGAFAVTLVAVLAAGNLAINRYFRKRGAVRQN